jgi:phage terminase small subunit
MKTPPIAKFPAKQKSTAVAIRDTEGNTQVVEASFGPAMMALTDKQRAFVMALSMMRDSNGSSAAASAGYTGTRDTLQVTASRLKAHPKVQTAIHEEAERQLFGAKLLASSVLLEVMGDANAKAGDRLKAVGMVLNRTGMSEKTEHHVIVEHTRTEVEMIAEVAEMAKRLGLDPRAVLGQVGVTIDADFKIVTDGTAGLEDVL